MASKPSLICDCGSKADDYFIELSGAGRSKEGTAVWVHLCGRPHLEIFERWLQRCEECLSEFSSPWEVVCVSCHRTNQDQQEQRQRYRGWRWAAKQPPPWHYLISQQNNSLTPI